MKLTVVTAVLSICSLFASAAPQASLPWQILSPASPVGHGTNIILRFEPLMSVDEVWEAFKAEHSTRYVILKPKFHYIYLVRNLSATCSQDLLDTLSETRFKEV